MLRILFSLILFASSFPISAQAQSENEQPGFVQKYGPRRQISTIVYTGLGGAVLGLSTLSFYGRPQDYLGNIPMGFGIGIIIGTIYMTYQAATNPDEFYRQSDATPYSPGFQELPIASTNASNWLVQNEPTKFTYEWNF